MKKPFVAEIVKDSKRLLRECISVGADFPQKLKFIVSEKLYALAMDSLLCAQDIARLGERRAAEQQPRLKQLVDHNDRLQALIDVAYELRCFKSSGQYEGLIRLACDVGKQAGAWLVSVERKINPLPIQQSPRVSVRAERLGALSTDSTSTEVKP